MELILWVNNDLTGFAGGASPAGSNALSAYFQSDNSQHINFIDEIGHVHELYRSANPTSQWLDNDLTSYARSTLASLSSAVAGFPDRENGQHVIFVGEDGHVHELYRSPNSKAQWVDNDLRALDGGMPVDAVDANGIQKCVALTSGFGLSVPGTPALGADDTVYVGTNPAGEDGALYALNPADGTPLWLFRVPGGITSSPAIGGDGSIYFGAAQAYAVNPADGTQKWAFNTGVAAFDASPAIGADGTIYFCANDGSLYALD